MKNSQEATQPTDPQLPTHRLVPGNTTLTRRILKRCRDRGFVVQKEGTVVAIGGGRWGFNIAAYTVPADIYEQEVARRDKERAKADKAQAQKDEQERIARREQQIRDLSDNFPKLDQQTVESLVAGNRAVYSAEAVGYQFRRGTKSYWDRLGYQVIGAASGWL